MRLEAEIYSKPNCPYCDKAKLRLVSYNPKIYMLDTDYTREDFFKKFPNAKTFPQIILNGEKIGGYLELEKWFDKFIIKQENNNEGHTTRSGYCFSTSKGKHI